MQITGTTTLLGLIGSPVEHSKSPQMYNHCFQKFGLDYAYLAFDVTPDEISSAVKAIRTLHLRGVNITMPCKAAVIPFLDNITPAAKAIGAVNTVVNDGGVLTGHNTDGLGYTQNLRRHGVEVKGKRIVLLGGGAGSAIAVQAALEGAAEILVFNRKDSFWPRVESAMQAAKDAAPACCITLQDLGCILPTPNAPGQRVFSRCAAPFFLEIRQYSCGKMSCSAQKLLAAGHIGSWKNTP